MHLHMKSRLPHFFPEKSSQFKRETAELGHIAGWQNMFNSTHVQSLRPFPSPQNSELAAYVPGGILSLHLNPLNSKGVTQAPLPQDSSLCPPYTPLSLLTHPSPRILGHGNDLICFVFSMSI